MADRIRGLNWADKRDNFQTGVLYLSGLTPDDTHESASVVADRVIGQMYLLTGANTVRMPINEATVGDYWNTYTGAIDTALAKGRVILCYWAAKDGKPADNAAFNEMWTTVVGKYGRNERVYIEPINEPRGYDLHELNDFYAEWLAKFPRLPRRRVILDGSKYAQVPATVGADGRLDGCRLGYHEYSFFDSFAGESEWRDHIRSDVGIYSDRTICTEFGAVMKTGTLGKTRIDSLLNYGEPSNDQFVVYVRAMTEQLREWRIGSVYWPGIRDDDIYALCTRSGDGSDIVLAINNPTGLSRVRYGWGVGQGA